MSYDVALSIDTGAGRRLEVIDLGNYTSNVSPMWDLACDGVGSPNLRDLHGRSCGEIAPGLLAAVRFMVVHWVAMVPMEPENGWGNYDGALRYLARIAQGCRGHPRCVLEVCA